MKSFTSAPSISSQLVMVLEMLLSSQVELMLVEMVEVLNVQKVWSCKGAAVVAALVMQLTSWRRFAL